MSGLSILLSIFIVLLIILIYLSYRKIVHGENFSQQWGIVTDACTISQEPDDNCYPVHVGLIPDGNRRWRKMRGKSLEDFVSCIKIMINRMAGKDETVKKSPYRQYIKELSIYGLSADNISRDDDTIVMIEKCLEGILSDDELSWSDMRIQFIGERHLLPHNIAILCDMIEQKCSGDFVISIALGYSPIEDAKRLLSMQDGAGAGAGASGDKDTRARPIQSPIDLVIRTGGEKRSSGFFPLHTTYSEWIYTNKLFPEISESDLTSFMREFYSRKRNFGK